MSSLGSVNEGSYAKLTLTFRDENGDLASPSSGTYEVYDIESDTEMLAATVLPAPVSIGIIELPMIPSINAIVNNDNNHEWRRVTVEASYGGTKAVNGAFAYTVNNLDKVS